MAMLNPLDLSADAPWKKRYRAPAIAGSSRAVQNSRRGVIASNKDGAYQIYAWDTETDRLTQLTHDPAGVPHGSISADGEYVYYLRDQGGDEIGHYVRLPFAGGQAQDLTPNLPDYASFDIDDCVSGQALGFTAADDDGFHIYVFARDNMETPVFSLSRSAMTTGPFLSHDAEIAVIASTEKTGVAEYAIEAYDVQSGALIAELWDGPGSGTDVGGFSPVAGDLRLAGSSNAGGYHRPFIWHPSSGERQDIASDQFSGDVKVWHWSPDAQRLLLRQVHRARHSLYVYDIAAARVRKLDAPPGVPSPGSGFLDDGALQVHITDSAAPTRLLELDAESGQVRRQVIDLGVEVPAGIPWRSVTYKSSGGAQIQAWLATPPGDGPFPTIVHTHGGPDRRADQHLATGRSSLARSRFRLLQPQLPRINHLRLRLSTRHRRQPGRPGSAGHRRRRRVAAGRGHRPARPTAQDRHILRRLPDPASAGAAARTLRRRHGHRRHRRLDADV